MDLTLELLNNHVVIGGATSFTTLGSRVGIDLSTLSISRVTYPGVNGAISISTGTGHYRKNGGSWVNTPGTLTTTDYIEARIESSGSYSTAVELVFSIDGSPDTFTATTMADPVTTTYVPDPDGNDMVDPDGNLVEDF